HQVGYASDIQFLVSHIAGDLPGFILLYLRKLYFFFNDFEIPSNLSVYLYREVSHLTPWVWNHFGFYSSLGLVGMVLAIRKRKSVFLLYAYTLSLIVAILIFLNEARYRLPVAPYFIIFGAYALDFTFSKIKERKYGKTVIVVLVITVIFVLFMEPKGMRPVRADDLINFAYSWKKNGSIEKSDQYLNRAQTLYPMDARIYFNKGQNRFEQQDFEKAIINYEKGVHLNGKMTCAKDRLVDALFLLAKQKMDNGVCEGAIVNLEKILNYRPRLPGVLLNLGVCHAQRGRMKEAEVLFQKALKIDPEYGPAKANLLELGRKD
ncbi:MAG: tetratricopeptide repeat protein, partial [Nitrospinota bacterium]|nr:tetratricopeptide repeat protein [Nitrospinota bacterium]